MGPIERELRERAERGQYGKLRLNDSAYCVFLGAAFSLHDQWFGDEAGTVHTAGHWADIMSEAIEAAEALGL